MKNEEVKLDIVDYGNNFEGIAKQDGKVIFVPYAMNEEKIIGKVIKENKNYSIVKINEIVKESRYRVTPFCEVYKRCGGCSAQHIEYLEQLRIKRKNVENLLKNYNVNYSLLENTIGQGLPYYYRNKVQYPVRVDKEGKAKIGFYSKRSHEIVENNCCFIQNRVIDMLAKEIFNILIQNNFSGYKEEEGTGDIRHILIRHGYHTGEIMVVLVVNRKEIFSKEIFVKVAEKIISINKNIKSVFLDLNESKTNEILGEEVLNIYGEDYITDYIGEYKYLISPKSFFQVNTIQAEMLYETLKEKLELNGDEILFDLYSGVGSIGIFLSKDVKRIYGIEIEKSAVEMANINLKENNVKNAEYIAGAVEDKIEEFKIRNIIPDVIVVDPPRKGLDEKSIKYLLNFNAKKIGYVSCNPSTMVRDLKLLESKYDTISITPVDMFPHTSSVECVSVLQRKKIEK